MLFEWTDLESTPLEGGGDLHFRKQCIPSTRPPHEPWGYTLPFDKLVLLQWSSGFQRMNQQLPWKVKIQHLIYISSLDYSFTGVR